jgi:dienelactone hydrolase
MVKLQRIRQEDPFPLDSPVDVPLDFRRDQPSGAAGGELEVLESWRQRCATRLEELLGPLPERVPLELETLESSAVDGYRLDKVVFDTEDAMSVPAYRLVPDGISGPGPAVLAVHGHGPGKVRVVGLDETASPWDDYARQFALRGYVVLAPDMRCFGERVDWNPPDHYGCDTNLVHAYMEGLSPLSQNLWDLARALDVLESDPLVDSARIAVAGFSYGATLSLFLAAWDPRVSAAVVSGYFSSVAESHKMPWNMCGSQVLPGMLGRIEHLDLASLVAPRPLFVESGSSDDLFPAVVAAQEMEKLRVVYRLLGAADHLVHEIFEGGHRWHGDGVYPFVERALAPVALGP